MRVTCPVCGRQAAVAADAEEVHCDCGHRFDPSQRPTRADPFVGETFHGYRFDAWIGGGAMGSVYRARQLSLDRDVAIKVLPAELARTPSFVTRFHREAQALAALNHPHIVQVFDRGDIDGRLFLVMEFVDGRNLRDCLRDGGFEPAEAVRIVAALAGALDYAHERGIVHRDIKPENVLISRDGVVKIADFGLSRVLGSEAFDTRLTRTNVVLGTFEYMAPEQREARGTPDGRADIYAAAVVLYELLTGELPIGRFALPSEKTPQLDRRLDDIVDRGLAKNPDDRFARASSMGRALEALLSSPGAPVTVPEVDLSKRPRGRVRGPAERPKAPSLFEWRLDVLYTVLAGLGIVISLAGIYLIFDGEDIEVGLVDLDHEISGPIALVFGAILWNAAERARRHWAGARLLLLGLTAIGALTVIGIPVMIWTWATLLGPAMRRYIDARYRGASESEAAALAQGYAIERRSTADAEERRRKVVALNKIVSSWLFALAAGCFVTWLIAFVGSGRGFRDEGLFVFVLSTFFFNFGFLFWALARAIGESRALGFNAWVWTLLAPFAPGGAARARALARDQRDGLLQ